MSHYRRKKTKRRVHCQLCTQHKWKGNNVGRFIDKETFARKQADKDRRGVMEEYWRLEGLHI